MTIIGVPYTAEQISKRLSVGCTQPVVDAVQQAVDMAKELGCLQVGLTGYSSIVTQNGELLVEDRVGLTSGNSLTAAAASEALHQTMSDLKIAPEDAQLGIVGGLGNIGRVLALLEQEKTGKIILFGRRGRRRLKKLADEIITLAWMQIMHGHTLNGIAKTLHDSGRLGEIEQPTYEELMRVFGEESPVKVSLDLHEIRQCNLVITATNAPEPIILPEHIGDHPMVICDVAVPNDVDSDLEAYCPQVKVIRGGILKLPNDQSLAVRGMSLPAGQAYACVSETILLGMAGIRDHYSFGALQTEKVRQIQHMARQFGFKVVSLEAGSKKFTDF